MMRNRIGEYFSSGKQNATERFRRSFILRLFFIRLDDDTRSSITGSDVLLFALRCRFEVFEIPWLPVRANSRYANVSTNICLGEGKRKREEQKQTEKERESIIATPRWSISVSDYSLQIAGITREHKTRKKALLYINGLSRLWKQLVGSRNSLSRLQFFYPVAHLSYVRYYILFSWRFTRDNLCTLTAMIFRRSALAALAFLTNVILLTTAHSSERICKYENTVTTATCSDQLSFPGTKREHPKGKIRAMYSYRWS